MKTGRLLTTISVLSLSLLIFLIAFSSVILGDEKTSESTTETLISQIQDLQKEIEALKERISKLESGQEIPWDPSSGDIIPHMDKLPKGSQRKEINGMTYYIIPLQDQSVDKRVLPSGR